MVNVWYGTVRKKSKESPPAKAATMPATRSPVAAAATTHTTSTKATVADVTSSRHRPNSAQVTAGRTMAAPTITARGTARHDMA